MPAASEHDGLPRAGSFLDIFTRRVTRRGRRRGADAHAPLGGDSSNLPPCSLGPPVIYCDEWTEQTLAPDLCVYPVCCWCCWLLLLLLQLLRRRRRRSHCLMRWYMYVRVELPKRRVSRSVVALRSRIDDN